MTYQETLHEFLGIKQVRLDDSRFSPQIFKSPTHNNMFDGLEASLCTWQINVFRSHSISSLCWYPAESNRNDLGSKKGTVKVFF